MHTLKGTRMAIFLGMLPSLLIYVGIAVVPIFISIYYSFFDWDGITAKNFVGIENFINILKDDIFWISVKNNVIIMVTGLLGQLPLGLMLAILLNGKFRGAAFFRTVGFMPVVISAVMVSMIWSLIYNMENGFLNNFLEAIGLESLTRSWLGDTSVAMYSISLAYIWQNCGLYMIILLAALQQIPSEVNEAAELDGATGLSKVFRITIPIIRSTLLVCVIYSISNSFRVFDLVQVLTAGGPAHMTEVMTIYMYNNAFINREFGYGSAAAVLILIFSLIVVGIANRVGREKD